MRRVSVTRILNEDDIVEAFVRHNASHVDHMVVFDNGSTDRTLEILKALKEEGFALSVFQLRSVNFDEVAANTALYHHANQLHGADWVIFLDTDEFIAGAKLDLPAENVLAVPLVHYGQTGLEDEAELNVALRMRWRAKAETNVFKTFIRGGMPGIVMDAGSHVAFQHGEKLAGFKAHGISLAHYPRRNGWQNLQKFALGWLKTLAAGERAVAAERCLHYRSPFETLRDKPWELIGNPAYLGFEIRPEDAVEAPLEYLGGALRYTQKGDAAMKAFELGLRYAEQLAVQHGRLMEQSGEARGLVERWNAERRFLF